MCGWSESMVEMNGINEGGIIEESSFVNNSDGGIKVEGGEISVIKCEFEENNHSIQKYLMMKENK
jgi:hypothetical protein